MARQVEPNLEQVQRIRLGLMHKRHHLRVLDAASSSEPLRVAIAVARRAARGVTVVNEALRHDGNRLEPSVGMRGKPWHRRTVVHAPTPFVAKVHAQVTVYQQLRVGSQVILASWIRIQVVHTEQEGIERLEGRSLQSKRSSNRQHVAVVEVV